MEYLQVSEIRYAINDPLSEDGYLCGECLTPLGETWYTDRCVRCKVSYHERCMGNLFLCEDCMQGQH